MEHLQSVDPSLRDYLPREGGYTVGKCMGGCREEEKSHRVSVALERVHVIYTNYCTMRANDTITIIVARGVCAKHGAKDACSVPGCSTNSQSKGLCGKHGANGSCTFPGCEVRNIYTTEYIYR